MSRGIRLHAACRFALATAVVALLFPTTVAAQVRALSIGDAAAAQRDTVLAPLSSGRIATQVAVGVGSGAVGGLLVGGAFYVLTASTRDGYDDGWETLFAVALGGLVGYPLGATTGVYLYSDREDQRGSMLATIAGGAAGTLVGAALAEVTGGLSFVVGIPLGAATGFNLTRRAR